VQEVKEKRVLYAINLIAGTILCLVFATAPLFAQAAAADAEAGQKRLKRARALIAAHKLGAAATELSALRNTTTDDSVRDVARIMLMSVYLEEGDYMRAQSLLEETYRLRSPGNENSTRTYYALAGQAVGSAREHLSRYRSFGINITDKDLPPEAASDLDHMRMLLERVAEQAREMCSQNEKSSDALGLLEEVASVRGTLARNKQERLQWQQEIANVRQKLAGSEIRIASTVALPVNTISLTSAPHAKNPAPSSASAVPNHSTDTGVRKPDAPPETAKAASEVKGNAPVEGRTGSSAPGGQPVEIGSLIDRATQKVNPSYPQTAKVARITGVVTVYLEIDETGSVAAVRQTNGPQLLRQAAVDAVRRWRFRPTIIDGHAVRVMGYINFNFTL
jgi:TonB family protein